MNEHVIDVGKDFSAYPGGRTREDGPNSGEKFRDDLLIPALRRHNKVSVIIDTVKGYGSSFLEESFGALIEKGFTVKEIKEKLEIVNSKPAFDAYKSEIWEYINGRA